MISNKLKTKLTPYLVLLVFTSFFSSCTLIDYSKLSKEKNKTISCRIGMTMDPNRRKKELERKCKKQGQNIISWNIIKTYKSKSSAQEFETKEAKKQNCEAHPGGRGPEKATWYIYKLEYLNQ